MSDNNYMDYISSLTEDELRQIVLIPLLHSIGFRDVIEYHGGAAEKGKDIICYYTDPIGEKRYLAIVVKRTDIHGAVGKTGNAGEILIQIEQSFNEPYTDIYNLKELLIDECWIVTSREIKNTAIESIRGTLQKSNLSKFIRFIDAKKIIELVNMYMPEFWQYEIYYNILLHQIRTPIQAIKANVALLEYEDMDRSNKEEIKRYLNDINKFAMLIEMLIRRNYFLNSKDRYLELSSIDLGQFLKHITLQFTGMSIDRDEKGCYIDFRIIGSRKTNIIEVNEEALEQAIFCILDNAFRFSYKSKAIEVTLSCDEIESIIRIKDYGIGIPNGFEEKIFQPFFRTEEAIRNYVVGPGIGLTVAQKILRLHGGDVRLTRNADPTEFSIYLPNTRNTDDHHRRR